jgi:hypothetical protein
VRLFDAVDRLGDWVDEEEVRTRAGVDIEFTAEIVGTLKAVEFTEDEKLAWDETNPDASLYCELFTINWFKVKLPFSKLATDIYIYNIYNIFFYNFY